VGWESLHIPLGSFAHGRSLLDDVLL